jgi:hypothetical protein
VSEAAEYEDEDEVDYEDEVIPENVYCSADLGRVASKTTVSPWTRLRRSWTRRARVCEKEGSDGRGGKPDRQERYT